MRGLRRRVGLLLLAVAATAGLTALGVGDAAAQSGGVLVVGDSLEVGTGPHLRRELGSMPLTIDARKSRPSSVGLGVLREKLRPGHRVVVFDLGVNDDPSQPAALARVLQAVRRTVGDRCLVVSTLSRPPLGGVRIDGMNRAITDFVAATPDAQLFDWHDASTAEPGLLGPDGLHPGPAGYATRARLLAGVIESCLDPGAPVDEKDVVPQPRDKTPAPAPPAAPRRRTPEEPGWLSLARRLPLRSLLTVAQSAIDRVDLASRELAGAVSARRAEPTLGGPPAGPAAR